ncbi:hypothetical protein V1264_023393 [Littorina saxatilis]|uniref:Major facilitator superfamily (MFS) profile domain-containing protein n=1 Tax=Littorina saxatilis TaxID=31220 RepID=A0AAN9B742_9CAEN
MAKWTIYHPVVFFLTFFSYAFFHAIRKTLSNVKKTLSEEWTPCTNDVNKSVTSLCTPSATWDSGSPFFKGHDDAEEFLGAVDAAFLFAYSLGLYVSGNIADRLDLRLVLTTGMIVTSAVVFIFGPVLEWTGGTSQPAYLTLMVVNGLLQSVGFPCVVAVMGNWFGKNSRGFVMGLWSSCQSVGNIIGSLMVSAVVNYGYEYAFLVTSGSLFCCGILVFVGLVPTPLEVGLPLADEEEGEKAREQLTMVYVVEGLGEGETAKNGTVCETMLVDDRNCNGAKLNGEKDLPGGASSRIDSDSSHKILELNAANGIYLAAVGTTDIPTSLEKNGIHNEDNTECAKVDLDSKDVAEKTRPKAIGWLAALLLPGVIPYSLAYAFLKLVNYVFFFWLPFYLSSAYGWRESTADQLSIWYDVGGIVGGTVAGFLSDRCGKRALVVVPMLVLGIPMLFIYGNVSAGGQMLINAVMLTCTGVLIGGVANIISAAITADLGRQDVIRGNSEALSTVTGIVDGSGSLGAAIGQVAVPYLEVAFGWRSVFYLFMAAVSATIVCITPILIAEVKMVVEDRRKRKNEGGVK